jgi:hypothetical protein
VRLWAFFKRSARIGESVSAARRERRDEMKARLVAVVFVLMFMLFLFQEIRIYSLSQQVEALAHDVNSLADSSIKNSEAILSNSNSIHMLANRP